MTNAAEPVSLHEELKQNAPFRNRAHEALLGVLKTASVSNRSAAKLLAAKKLSLAQYNVLRILRGAEPAGLATLAIRDRMIDPAAAITRLIDKLEASGMVRRERGEGDRRLVNCRITERGLETLAALDPPINGIDIKIGQLLSGEELDHLNALLERMRAGLR
jgi:DNA-binding MarR family transcriptional regulator